MSMDLDPYTQTDLAFSYKLPLSFLICWLFFKTYMYLMRSFASDRIYQPFLTPAPRKRTPLYELLDNVA